MNATPTDRMKMRDETRIAVLEQQAKTVVDWQAAHTIECTSRYRSLNARIDQLGFAIWGATVTTVMTLIAVIAQLVLHQK